MPDGACSIFSGPKPLARSLWAFRCCPSGSTVAWLRAIWESNSLIDRGMGYLVKLAALLQVLDLWHAVDEPVIVVAQAVFQLGGPALTGCPHAA